MNNFRFFSQKFYLTERLVYVFDNSSCCKLKVIMESNLSCQQLGQKI